MSILHLGGNRKPNTCARVGLERKHLDFFHLKRLKIIKFTANLSSSNSMTINTDRSICSTSSSSFWKRKMIVNDYGWMDVLAFFFLSLSLSLFSRFHYLCQSVYKLNLRMMITLILFPKDNCWMIKNTFGRTMNLIIILKKKVREDNLWSVSNEED